MTMKQNMKGSFWTAKITFFHSTNKLFNKSWDFMNSCDHIIHFRIPS
jgi:hypothetical protein